jgi:hypothetical protein
MLKKIALALVFFLILAGPHLLTKKAFSQAQSGDGIQVFTAASNYDEGKKAVENINSQINNWLKGKGIKIIQSNMFTSTVGASGNYVFFVTVSIHYTSWAHY